MNSTMLAKENCFHEENMQTPDIVDKIIHLSTLGWGKKKIAKELGISKNTVKRYLNLQEWKPYPCRQRVSKLSELQPWLEDTFHRHRGNAAVVQQELQRQLQLKVSPRTVQRAVKPLRQKLIAAAKATLRFETLPGQQMQIDFGSITATIAGEPQRIFLFVATLGFSRRHYVKSFRHERQNAWMEGIEGAFRHFQGVPQQLLIDNARPLVISHNVLTREVIFNEKFHAFSNYWGVIPKACAPYRARTKGKDESAVKYVKGNAIAGREFSSYEALDEHLAWWIREISDIRIHGTTHEKPIDRFLREEAAVLRPLNGKAPFNQIREVTRVAQNDACIELDKNFYSVPWQFIKERLVVQVVDNTVYIYRGEEQIASHPMCFGTRQRVIDQSHLAGIVSSTYRKPGEKNVHGQQANPVKRHPELLRSLAYYEEMVGGGW